MSMHEISCPHCNKAFQIDEAGYASILKQVRDETFESEIADRLQLAEDDKRNAVELAESKAANAAQDDAVKKDNEIQQLRAQLDSVATKQELAVTKAVTDLKSKRDVEVAELKAVIASRDTSEALAIAQAVGTVEKQRDELQADLKLAKAEEEIKASALKDKYENQIHERDEAIERLKDLKAKLSTKMLGETLEQHCEIQFNQLRATAFPGAYFEKDNDASSGSKGDYIFRDADDSDTEIVSVMFEMKTRAIPRQPKRRTKTFLRSWTRTAMRRAVNTLFWCHCSSRTASCTTRVLSTCLIGTQKCMSSGPSSLFPLSPCFEMQRWARWSTSRS